MKNIKLYSKKVMFMMIIVLMLVISTVSYTLSTLADADKKVTQDITDFSRGSYDILLRPAGARTDLEKQLNLIEENYLGIGDGGITIDQWLEIKNHPQVEIAAPVASIGLFTARKRTWMIERKDNLKYYEVDYRTSDGLKSYTYNKDAYIYDFQGDLDKPIIWYASSLDVGNSFLGDDVASFDFPISYHQVVAVDPEEERKLTDYEFGPLNEKVIDKRAYNNGEFAIPVMSLKDVPIPNTIQLTVDDLVKPTEEELSEWTDKFVDSNPIKTMVEYPAKYQKVVDEFISKKRMHNEEEYLFGAEDGPSPFEDIPLYVNDDMKLAPDDGTGEGYLGGGYESFTQRIGYQLGPVIYEITDNKKLVVKKTGVDDNFEAPTYREIEEVDYFKVGEDGHPLNQDKAFEFSNIGFFSIQENADTLASAPLGIYGREMPHLASDPSVKLHPSAVPGSFITTPAHGLISMEHAEKVKGKAPIDAIRVKVAGLAGYDEAAASLIRKLADEWEDEGFTVDIVAGASVQDLTVDVEGIGKVVQPFTTLGAADTVLSSWNMLQVALTVLYGLVALTFVGFTFFNLLADRQGDEQLLAQLGWSEKLIRWIRYKEWLWMLGTPIVLVMIGFTLFGAWKGQWLPLILSVGISGIFVLLFILANLSQKRQLRRSGKRGKTVTIQNIWFYRFSLLASCIQLFLTTILTCFLPFFLLQHVEKTTQTRLGSYVHGEIEGLFIVIIILLYILSLTTVYQSLSRMWKKRASEIQLFLYLGWGAKAIRTYFLKEVLLWAGFSTIVGWGVSLSITLMMVEITSVTVLSGVAGFILILAVTLVGSIYSLHRVQIKGGDTFVYQAT